MLNPQSINLSMMVHNSAVFRIFAGILSGPVAVCIHSTFLDAFSVYLDVLYGLDTTFSFYQGCWRDLSL